MIRKDDTKEGRLVILLAQAMGEATLLGSTTKGVSEDVDNLVECLEKGLRVARGVRAERRES